MKNFIRLTLVVGLIGGALWVWKSRSHADEEAQPTYKPAVVEQKTLRRFVESTGEVRPENRLRVKSPVSGRIEELLVDEGEIIERGDIIAWISSTERATLLDAARAKSKEELLYWENVYKPAPLIAPMGGTIIDRSFEPGQTINSSDAVVVIADELILVGQVDETDIGSISMNQTVEIELDAYLGSVFEGTVSAIAYDSKMISNVTMYEVDVTPKDLPLFARSGMTATLTFVAETHENVPAVPTAALDYADGQAFVIQPSAKRNEPRRIAVTLGLNENGFTEISGELQVGDPILIPQIVRKKEMGSSPFMPNRKKK